MSGAVSDVRGFGRARFRIPRGRHREPTGTLVSAYRSRDREFVKYFDATTDFVFCKDVPGLLRRMGVPEYNADDWRLFIDSSTSSLKCVLLHNGNEWQPVPLGYSAQLKEDYDATKLVL